MKKLAALLLCLIPFALSSMAAASPAITLMVDTNGNILGPTNFARALITSPAASNAVHDIAAAVYGGGITTTDASLLVTGTLPDSRLSTNIVTQTYSGNITAGGLRSYGSVSGTRFYGSINGTNVDNGTVNSLAFDAATIAWLNSIATSTNSAGSNAVPTINGVATNLHI